MVYVGGKILISHTAISRLRHAEPLVGLWRRYHYSHRSIYPTRLRQALAPRLVILESTIDSYKLGGKRFLLLNLRQRLTLADRIRVQDSWARKPLWRWFRNVAYQGTSTRRKCLWFYRQIRGSRYLLRYVQEQSPRYCIPIHHGNEWRRFDSI